MHFSSEHRIACLAIEMLRRNFHYLGEQRLTNIGPYFIGDFLLTVKSLGRSNI